MVANGSQLLFARYLGGQSNDVEYGIGLDAQGDIYVGGRTSSSDFPKTQGEFQANLAGPSDAFATKLKADGSGLVYSAFLGGSGEEGTYPGGENISLAVDARGNAYLRSDTNSSNFPTTHGAFQGNLSEDLDAFVTKLNPDGSELIFSTYLGGSSAETGFAIAVDVDGNIYATGSTDSVDFPTLNAVQPTLRGGQDAFIVKIADSDGSD